MPTPSSRTTQSDNLTLDTFPDRARPVAGTYSRTTTTVTVTSTAHGLPTGRKIKVVSATDAGLVSDRVPANWPAITVTDANTFTFPTTSSGTATGSISYIGAVHAYQLQSDPSFPA